MGAFFISNTGINISEVKYHFQRKGFNDAHEIIISNKHILVYRKLYTDHTNVHYHNGGVIFSVGTVVYKSKFGKDCLKSLCEDFINNTFEYDKIIGSFFIYFFFEGKEHFIVDRAGIQNIYHNFDHSIISSSFLATLIALNKASGKQIINKLALKENLLTGSLIGPDTIIENISRYEISSKQDLGNIKLIPSTYNEVGGFLSKNKSEEIERQLFALGDYFSSIVPFLKRYGACTGLTSGFDSRLIYLFLKKCETDLTVFTNYRGKKSVEFEYASKLANAAGDMLLERNYPKVGEIDSTEMSRLIRDNFLFNDGLIRTHQLWTEVNKSSNDMRLIYNKDKVGFSGVGGEQYRNSEFLVKKQYNLKKWIKSELVLRHVGNPFLIKKQEEDFIEYLKEKICHCLNLSNSASIISILNIKRYYNEIWNPANRTIRNNIENQMVFFLSPFTEYTVSRAAYASIPFHGVGLGFEKEMIKKTSPEFAGIQTEYNCTPSGKEPLKYMYIGHLKNMLGLQLYNYLYYINKKRSQNTFDKFINVYPEFDYCIYIFKELFPDLKENNLVDSNYLSLIIVEAAFFLKEMDEYVRFS